MRLGAGSDGGAGAYTKGDFEDLAIRLSDARKKPIDFSGTPQPQSGSDSDIRYYQTSGRGLDVLNQTANAAVDKTNALYKKSVFDQYLPYMAGAAILFFVYKITENNK
jgi:hypothetical protein